MASMMVRGFPLWSMKWLTTAKKVMLFSEVHRSKERCMLLLLWRSISFTTTLCSWNASKIHLRMIVLEVDRCSTRVFENNSSRSLKNWLLYTENAICMITIHRMKKYLIFFTRSRPMRDLNRGSVYSCSVTVKVFITGVLLLLTDASIREHSHRCSIIFWEDVTHG